MVMLDLGYMLVIKYFYKEGNLQHHGEGPEQGLYLRHRGGLHAQEATQTAEETARTSALISHAVRQSALHFRSFAGE